jgi:hypothetical protein
MGVCHWLADSVLHHYDIAIVAEENDVIYTDPTETRSGTRLPVNVIKVATNVAGLEAATGADFLLSPVEIVADKIDPKIASSILDAVNADMTDGDSQSPIHLSSCVGCTLAEAVVSLSFIRAIRNGLLVQRKTGRDLTNSIPHLHSIFTRMCRWTCQPWLLFVGDIKASRKGDAIVDGHNSGYTYAALQGALETWQRSGGGITLLSRDSLVLDWCVRHQRRLNKESKTGKKIISVQMPNISRKYPWADTLTTLPGIGGTNALALAKHYKTLAGCIVSVCDPGYPKFKTKPSGARIGPKTIQNVRAWLGLDDGYSIGIIELDKEK